MKVAVVTQYFPTSHQPWAGHSAYQTLRLLATLCDLHVFYPEARYPPLLTPKTARRPKLDPTWQPPGVPVTYLSYPVLPLLSRPLNGLVMARRLLPAVRAFRPDVILNYVVYPDGFAALRIAQALGKPLVLTAIGSDLNRIPGGPSSLVGRLTRHTLRHANLTTTVSDDLRKTALSLGARSALTIVNGCDTAVFHPGNPLTARAEARHALSLDPQAELILYVGRLDLRKGLLELIEAAASLRATHPRAHTFLVGDGPDRPALLAAIAQHNAADLLTLIPSCPTAQVAQWMAAANLVTLPSYREGCPNVVLEALAAGRPVVASNVGGIPELMDHSCGRLIPTHNSPALAQALNEVLLQPWNPQAISQKNSRSWLNVAQDLHQALTQAQAPPPPS